MEEAARQFPDHAWIYGTENTMAKMSRMGFNAMNPFALPTGFLPLLPGYRAGLSPEEDFAQLDRLLKKFKWGRKGGEVLGSRPHSPAEWDPVLRELRGLTNMPFYIDLYTTRPARLSQRRETVGKRLDVERLFYPKAGKGFSQTFRLTSSPGRDALTALYVKDAETYKALGVKPFAYKLLNESRYTDDSSEFRECLSAELLRRFGTASIPDAVRAVEAQKLRERLMTDAMRDVRTALQKVEPGTPTFVQTHAQAWRMNWNNIDLYSMNRQMDIVSIGTGDYAYQQPERGDAPSPALADAFGRYAFYRAQAHGKPLVASEAYFGGMGRDRTPWLEKMLWYQAAEGVALVNLWEWNHPFADRPKTPFALANAFGCRPETWDNLPRLVRELGAMADFFPCGVRRMKTRLACLYSTATQRFDQKRTDAYCAAVTELEFHQIRADAIFEEQLVPGDDCRIGDYDVIVAAGVDELLPRTAEALCRWMDGGGRLIAVDSMLDRDEYGVRGTNGLNLAARAVKVNGMKELLNSVSHSGVRPFVRVTDAPTGKPTSFLRVVRAENADGLVGWFVANYTEESKIVTLEAEDLKGMTAISPFGTNDWPLVEGRMTILVPAQFHALAVTGPDAAIVARFGHRARMDTWRLKALYAAAVAADRARTPKRASVPVDLRGVANAGFDNQQGWADGTAWNDDRGCDLVGVPYHTQTFRSIDFDIIRFDFNDNRTTVALASKSRPSGLSKMPPIGLGGKPFRGLALLAAATHARKGETAATLEVKYADGVVLRVPIRVGRELGNWIVEANAPEMRANCVWQMQGKGLFLWEWSNPRPSVPLESFSFSGGDGASAANIVAVSALKTLFEKSFAERLDLSGGRILRDRAACCFKFGAGGFDLGGRILTEGVLRYEVRQPPKAPGDPIQFERAFAVARGLDADGMGCTVDPHCLTVAGRHHILCSLESVTQASDWAEVELRLSDICRGINVRGEGVPLAKLTSLSLGGAPRFEYRNARLEFDGRPVGR